MATPAYKGVSQPGPVAGNGWLSRLGSMVGMSRRGATPSYDGVGQPTSSSGGFFAAPTPAYVTAPVAAPTVIVDSTCDACPIDPEAIAQGQIAIVIPRRNGVSTQ
jgi:hypothetical protein